MWKKWEATEAPLRQGRGWYPTLVSLALVLSLSPLVGRVLTVTQDRHFLELLVISEIHCLSHPLQGYNNPSPSPNAERIHRHASRVRRVACDRIGSERLHAYCDRVKEAFEAYVQGGWGNGVSEYMGKSEMSDDNNTELDVDVDLDLDVDDKPGMEKETSVVLVGDEERGRGLEREGSSLKRRDSGPSPPKNSEHEETPNVHQGGEGEAEGEGEMDVSMVVDVSPLSSPIPSLSHTDSDGEDGETTWDEAEREMHKIDLEGVVEVPEDEADEDNV